MPTVHFVNGNQSARAGPLADLRRVARFAGVNLYNGLAKVANCHGMGTCGTCRVHVEPQRALTPPTRRERLHGCTGPMRLACQARIADDRTEVIRITKMTGFLGKGRTPVPGPGVAALPKNAVPAPPPTPA